MRVNDWVLVHEETNEEVEAGASVTSFRGEPDVVKGGTPPHKPSSTGRVWVNGGEFFPKQACSTGGKPPRKHEVD
jgi:hypothetical protein